MTNPQYSNIILLSWKHWDKIKDAIERERSIID